MSAAPGQVTSEQRQFAKAGATQKEPTGATVNVGDVRAISSMDIGVFSYEGCQSYRSDQKCWR